jgi:hypothetical protein
MEGMHRLHERPATDRFSHDAMSRIDLVPQTDLRTRALASGCPMIVMVESPHNWKSDYLVPCMMRGLG